MAPFKLTVADDRRPASFSFDDEARGYSVAIIVRNRSDAYLKDCVAHVMNDSQSDCSDQPRFVEQFDIPPKMEKTVFVAYWQRRLQTILPRAQPAAQHEPTRELLGQCRG